MKLVLFALVAGLGVGGFYALLGQGLVVAFRGSGVINFAHGAIAAYTAFVFNEFRAKGSGDLVMPWPDPIPEWHVLKVLHINNLPTRIHLIDNPGTVLSVVVALAMAAVVGLLMHLLVFRPLRNAPPLAKIIGSVGVLLYLQAITVLNFGSVNRVDRGWWLYSSDVRTVKPLRNFLWLGGVMPVSSLILAGTACVVGFVLWALYRWTLFGLATRAANENEKGASLLGFSPQLIAGVNWVVSSVLAGFAGIVFVSQSQPNQLFVFVIAGLSAALVGNLTSIPGVTLGGFLIGAAASGGAQVASQSWWPKVIPAEGLRQVVPLIVIIVVLYARGGRLPTREFISVGRQPTAPAARHGMTNVVVVLGAAALLSNIFTNAWESTLTTTLVFALFMLSLVVLVGYLGQVSLAQWSLSGVAAWTVARLAANGVKIRQFDSLIKHGPGLATPLAMIGAVLAATIVGVIVGLPALRIRGVQLAVVTLASVVAIEYLILRNTWLMGDGASGQNPMPTPSLFGQYVGSINPTTQRGDYWKFTAFLLIITVLVGVGVMNLRRGVFGRRFLAVRANERAAAAAGIDVARTKLIGFAISSAIAGVAGVMYAYKLPSLSTDSFNMFVGLVLVAFVYLGSITRVSGALIGGCLAAGGLVAQFGQLHFSDIKPAVIYLAGAIGLIINAIATHGEGISALITNYVQKITGGLRTKPTALVGVMAEERVGAPVESRATVAVSAPSRQRAVPEPAIGDRV